MAYAFYHRGLAYSGQQNYEHAILDYGEAIRHNPRSVASFYQRGRAYRALGDEARAAADTAQAASLDPGLLAVYQRRDARSAQ